MDPRKFLVLFLILAVKQRKRSLWARTHMVVRLQDRTQGQSVDGRDCGSASRHAAALYRRSRPDQQRRLYGELPSRSRFNIH